MKAGTVVLFTLFLPVLAGPPVEAAEWSAHGPPFWHDARYFGDEEILFETFDNFLDKELNEVNEDDEDEDWQPRRFIDFHSKFSRKFKEFDLDDFPNFDEYVRKRKNDEEVRAKMRAKDRKLKRLNMRLEKRLEGMKWMTQRMTQKSLRELKKQIKQQIKLKEQWREEWLERKRLKEQQMNEMNEKMNELMLQEEEEVQVQEVQMMPLHYETKGAKTGQRSIILGLSTLTIFSGLAFLIFWILERQQKFSRTNIKG